MYKYVYETETTYFLKMQNQQLSEDFLSLLWQSIQHGGVEFWVFIIIFILLIFKAEIPALVKGLWKGICWVLNFLFVKNKKTNSIQKYDRNSLINHQLFKDIEYWQTIGINIVQITDNKAKEQIAKDIFKIYIENSKKIFTNMVNKNNLQNMTNDELKSLIKREIEKKNSNVVYEARQEGIPELFLQKYFMISEGFQSLKNSVIDTILSNDFEADNYTKLYIILNTIDGTIANIFHNLVATVKSTNGDLNGLEYKGFIIGYRPNNTLLPPTGIETNIVEEKLKELMYSLNASRAYIYKFHPAKDFASGIHSCVYEVVNAGISVEKHKLQKVHNTFLSLPNDMTHDVIIKQKREMDDLLLERMNQRGIYSTAGVLLFNGDEKHADGFLVVNWANRDSYEQAIKNGSMNGTIDEKMKFYAELLKSYIVYPADYNFA